MGRRRFRISPFLLSKTMRFAWRTARKALMSSVLLGFLGLCLLGFLVGREEVRNPIPVPTDQVFDNLQVYSYRDSPSDTTVHFVVELTAFGKPFAEYDVDQRRFVTSGFGRRYDRAFSGAHYSRLRLRGHAGEGCWIAVPDSSTMALTQGQFDELTRKTLDYVKPFGVFTSMLGLCSGYSIGYRLGQWEASIANPRVQRALMQVPGIQRILTREAWRRVLLEPSFMSSQPDAGTFAAVLEQQRLYNRFYLLALEDTSGFVQHEADRLMRSGQPEYARAMTSFVAAVRRANSDSVTLTSNDFRAIETWASMLFSRGHWASYVRDTTDDARFRYLGALSHYNLSPPEGPSSSGRHARQVWIGPRALVKIDGEEGYISDEIPATKLGCPVGWKPFLLPGGREAERNYFAIRWVKPPGAEFLQVAKALTNITMRLASLARGGRTHTTETSAVESPSRHRAPTPPAHLGRLRPDSLTASAPFDSTVSPTDSLAHAWAALVDTVKSLVRPNNAAPADSTR
ncbi:MAG TPA: hypothetical protein VN896_04095 [Methylomirabilota bacterium]|nr:hypothetical protein [Methylomirabilota bacterium]